ncbi:13149_t:CDS:2, partial [Racocetra fulgida]
IIVEQCLTEGTALLKVSLKKKQQKVFRIDADQVNIESIKELLIGETIRSYRDHFNLGVDFEPRWFTIIYVDFGKYKTLHLVAPTLELFNLWVNNLEKLYLHRRNIIGGLGHLRKRQYLLLEQQWKQADKDGNSRLDFDDVTNIDQQNQMVSILRNTLGEYLVTNSLSENETELPSPASLLYKIILKGKKLPESSENNVDSTTDTESDPESNVESSKEKEKKAKLKIAQSLSDLIIYSVAVKFKGFDHRGMQIDHAMFAVNGRCGYVLKPERLRNPDIISPAPPTQTLTIEIISAQRLPKLGDALLDKVIDPFVGVELLIPGNDAIKKETCTISDNGFDPTWNETLKFTFNCEEMRYRYVPLNDFNGEQYLYTTLFIRSSLEVTPA